MKTKSTVRPSETHRIVLNLEAAELGGDTVEVGMFYPLKKEFLHGETSGPIIITTSLPPPYT
jgi:hypothetical protein